MADTLNIPEGVRISASPRGISIEFSGDIVLAGPVGPRVASIASSDGSITLTGDHQVEEVRTERGSIFLDGTMQLGRVVALGGNVAVNGSVVADEVAAPAGSVMLSGDHKVKSVRCAEDLQVSGALRGTTLRGGLVSLQADLLEASAVEGALRVDLGAGQYKVEIVIAPQIEVDPDSSGRINVIESNNELGPTNVKGRFRLAEYAEFTGIDAGAFLQERGVRSLMQLGQPVAVVARQADEFPTMVTEDLDDLVEVVPEPADGAEVIEPAHVGPPVSLMPDALEPLDATTDDLYEVDDELIPVGEADDDDETHAGPASNSTQLTVGATTYDVEETLDEALERESLASTLEQSLDEGDDVDDERILLEHQVKEHVLRLSGLYRNDEPQGIARLRRYVSTGQFANVKKDLPGVFNDVVRMHLEKNQRPHYQVVPTFNRIHALVEGL